MIIQSPVKDHILNFIFLVKPYVIYNIYILVFSLIIILMIAYLTLLERKVLSAVQRRKGPNKVGFWGLLQPIADAFKLILKEINVPARANLFLFYLGPMLMLFLNLMGWIIFTPTYGWLFVDLNLSILYILSLMGLNIYGFISAGWASNSKYSFLGAVRASAQMLGYELTTSTIVVLLAFLAGSFNISVIICSQQYLWNVIGCWPLFLLFFIGSLAETARVPFDLPEAESELVSGYNVEYASITFAFFFLAEYGNIIMASNLIVCFFFGGYFLFGYISAVFYFIKLFLFLFLFILIRATLPRFRFDQLMTLGWLKLLPLSMVTSLVVIMLVLCFGTSTSEDVLLISV